MNRFILAAFFLLWANSATAQDNALTGEAQLQVKKLYVCHYFYEAGSKSSNAGLREKSSQLSNAFLLRATAIAVGSGGQANAQLLASNARSEYASFLSTMTSLNAEAQSSRLQEFDADCSKALQTKIEYDRGDRSLQIATRLYFCADVHRILSERTESEERPQLAALSKVMHEKATAVASKNGLRPIDETLAADGRKQASDWAVNFDLSANERAKNALLTKVKRLCTVESNRIQ